MAARPIDPEKLVSISEVAREYGYHPSYLSRLAASGRLQAWKFAKTWVTTREAIETYVRSTPQPGRPKQKRSKRRLSS